ncbi:carboxypeptidase-like regulatory domain-containing protein [Mucilaginibacter pedocola]|uniref:Carboxypeptidase-like regulatory domain-containing protein n=1 Tax=Mucilaginibacter pedocola TaxID=1792845 RepID=A0A1S9PHE2_9SPHI|nr:carboxypeptidase-like regulatory domain-containing protein [Mucilaginibacter pedocola]OOQ60339.1 hypothetical protein BC343_25270 [Mucilaginibacter pedocola]
MAIFKAEFMSKRTVLILFILFPSTCFSQYLLSGKIYNSVTRQPLQDCSVFIENTTTGSLTNVDGAFSLKIIKNGTYNLTVSMLGFRSYKQPVTVNGNNLTITDIYLQPALRELKEVIVGDDSFRQQNLEWFKNAFIGNSPIAEKCRILNPDIIDLRYNKSKGILSGSSSDFIEIENPELGYKLKYWLNEFSLDRNSAGQSLHYDGSALFEELTGSGEDVKKWQKRRHQVYENSPSRFFRALLLEKVSEHYLVRRVRDEKKDGERKRSFHPGQLDKNDLLLPTNETGIWAFGCEKDTLQIDYDPRGRFYKKELYNEKTTLLYFNSPYVLLDGNGTVVNSKSISYNGAWGHSRIAELLPISYSEPGEETSGAGLSAQAEGQASSPGFAMASRMQALALHADSIYASAAPEIIYLQLNQPYYALNDSVRFKAYVLNYTILLPTENSGVLHISAFSADGNMIRQYNFKMENGMAQGSISLNEKEYNAGTITFKAYTNWMLNFNPDHSFIKNILISDPGESAILVQSSLSGAPNAQRLKLYLANVNKEPLRLSAINIEILKDKRPASSQKRTTGVDGGLELEIPQGEYKKMEVRLKQNGALAATLPFKIQDYNAADIQFLPEGGNAITGRITRMGFKILDQDGYGVAASGYVTIADFRSARNGMGSFEITYLANERYVAHLKFPDGAVVIRVLPEVKNDGTSLSVRNEFNKDSLTIIVRAGIGTGGQFFLTGSLKARYIMRLC